MADAEFDRGLALRRQMFGPAGADQQIAAATDFTRPLQEMVTRSCFGELWHRPHLDLKLRSMLTIAMLAALGKPNQIKLHVRGALANGVSRDEIREILLHAMAYGGIPAAVDSFAAAGEALAEVDGI
ncbi:carboxymuconolactone decarboxylase family protein [Sphingomonas sp. MMS24-J13]|uniref:carboxymuconolactone decarboxylase family protein n=1 Tax=Sphingomonas sp. MMS24-J13 TaxID=3238686 RepID=UPI00384A96D2